MIDDVANSLIDIIAELGGTQTEMHSSYDEEEDEKVGKDNIHQMIMLMNNATDKMSNADCQSKNISSKVAAWH